MSEARDYSNKNKGADHKGFSLVELVVVLTLMMIFIMVSAFGILSWQDWSEERTRSEYRQALFLSVQDKLTKCSANGTLEEFVEKLPENNRFWNYDNYEKVYYLKCEKGDYSRYIRKGRYTPGADVLFDILSDTVADGEILDEYMFVYFDVDKCVVIDAFYGEQK